MGRGIQTGGEEEAGVVEGVEEAGEVESEGKADLVCREEEVQDPG